MLKQSDFEILQPVEYRGTTGYISFISEYYISICFIDIPLPEEAHSRWGRHYVNLIVYPHNWYEIRCCLSEAEEKQEDTPRSDLLQFRGRQLMGAARKQNSTRKN
jgi:hypothetical protein